MHRIRNSYIPFDLHLFLFFLANKLYLVAFNLSIKNDNFIIKGLVEKEIDTIDVVKFTNCIFKHLNQYNAF